MDHAIGPLEASAPSVGPFFVRPRKWFGPSPESAAHLESLHSTLPAIAICVTVVSANLGWREGL
jgi:hypothetical protein